MSVGEGVGADGTYDGIAFSDLLIDTVTCSDQIAHHILNRTRRKDSTNEVDVEPSWAIEAALSDQRVIDDGRARSGLAIRVTGYSPSARRQIAVTLYSEEHPPLGHWHIATAWVVTTVPTNREDQS